MAPAILWFRRDLRLDDLPALAAAAEAGGGEVVPLFVVDPDLLGRVGPNRPSFLAGSLRALTEELDGRLVLRCGDPRTVVPSLAVEVGAEAVVVTADFTPSGVARDRDVTSALAEAGHRLVAVDSAYAVAPGRVRSAAGTPFQVFSPFYRAWERLGWNRPTAIPSVKFVSVPSDITAEAISGDTLRSSDLPEWWAGLPLDQAARLPEPGSDAAHATLQAFLDGPVSRYVDDRDRPALRGTSSLSPYLKSGCIHPRTVLARLSDDPGPEKLRSELAWREFYADVLWGNPESRSSAVQPFGDRLRWDTDESARDRFRAWATGRTGYPLVDAGMRQLLAEGWMHNRVRMVTASFLVKDLHIDWRMGARWFMWHLVDGDVASNQHNWQWVAGTGSDAAPFHRVLNPTLQQQRFDPDREYVRRYVAELETGDGTYPEQIVDHATERLDALARFAEARSA